MPTFPWAMFQSRPYYSNAISIAWDLKTWRWRDGADRPPPRPSPGRSPDRGVDDPDLKDEFYLSDRQAQVADGIAGKAPGML